MTLEEQIRPHAQYWDCYNDCPLEYNHTGKLIKITEEFAIGFAAWSQYRCIQKEDLKSQLEIYKKVKGYEI